MKKFLTLSLLAIFIFSGCSKYEDGPWISFKSKEKRLASIWKLEDLYIDGTEAEIEGQDPSNLDLRMEFKEGGTFEDFWGSSGSWEFFDSEEKIRLTPEGIDKHHELTILRLKTKEFWFEYEVGDKIHEEHYSSVD